MNRGEENDDPPGVEIYDGKWVCVVTGHHVAGTPLDVSHDTDRVSHRSTGTNKTGYSFSRGSITF
ncbi:hypothetical protein [Natronorarus salvus]|uniref:hypothetical protein n=1 Tax=Natronorarus salvus TaxID=3117733 RepID=UPI002F26C682